MDIRKFAVIVVLLTIFTVEGGAATAGPASNSYFPNGAFPDLPSHYSDMPTLMSGVLKAAREPVLHTDPRIAFAIRLTVVPAFGNGIIVRITKARKSCEIISKTFKYNVAGNGRFIESRFDKLRANDCDRLRELTDDKDFWSLGNRQDTIGSDGSEWLLEVRDNGKYHAVLRWWPNDGAVFELGSQLVSLAGRKLQDR